MYSGKVKMVLPNGIPVDLTYRLNPKKLKDVTVKSNSSKDLLKELSNLDELRGKWSIDKDNNDLTRLKIEDRLGGTTYILVYKSSTKEKSDKVYSGKIKLAYDNGVNLSLNNSFDDVSKVWDEVEKAKDAKTLCNSINKIDSFNGKWSVDKDTSKKTVLRKKDAFGSDMYMTVIKEAFNRIDIPNLTGVPMTPAGVGGGMPTRWIYSTYGRFLSVYGVRNKVSVTFNTASSDDIKNKLSSLYKMRDNGIVDNIDLQELEERLRTMSNVNIYGNGSTEPSQVAISEPETSDEIKEQKLEEEVKPTTSQAQLDHLEKIRPLAHTDEANEKRRKTIEAKKVEKLLGINEK